MGLSFVRVALGSALLAGVVCCGPSREVRSVAGRTVTFLHTADVHSHLFPERLRVSRADAARGLGEEGRIAEVGGAARLSAAIEKERAAADVVFLLDSGDLFEGTPVFELFGGRAELSVQRALAVDAAAAGNHDLDAGLAALGSREEAAPPLLGANLVSDFPGLLTSETVLERSGVRVGVVGLARSPTEPLDLQRAADAVNAGAARLRASADLLVVLSHLGTDADVALLPLTSGADLVLGGHTHDVVSPPEVVGDCGEMLARQTGCTPRGVFVFHPGAYGRYLGRIDMTLAGQPQDPGGATVGRIARVSSRLIPITSSVQEDAWVSALLEPYAEGLRAAGFDEPVAFAESDVPRLSDSGGDSALGNVVSRALRTLTEADLAVINSTALRADLISGVLTRADLFAAMPFPDALVGRLMTGGELARAFTKVAFASCNRDRQSQVQLDGVRVVFGCAGGGSAQITLRGSPLDPAHLYRVATSDFLAGEGGWLAGPLAPIPPLGTVRAALEAYVRTQPACGALEGADGGPGLPCLNGASGAIPDGRISWEK